MEQIPFFNGIGNGSGRKECQTKDYRKLGFEKANLLRQKPT